MEFPPRTLFQERTDQARGDAARCTLAVTARSQRRMSLELQMLLTSRYPRVPNDVDHLMPSSINRTVSMMPRTSKF